MDGYFVSRNGSSSSSNNFTYAQVLPPECANEIGKTYVDGHPALYLSPSTVRALKVYSGMEPITTTLDALFKKSFAATQNYNIKSRNLPTLPPPQTRQPANPRTLTPPPPMRTDFTSNRQKNSDGKKTVIVFPVESESYASNEQQIQSASCTTNPCTNESLRSRASIIAREIFTTCLCPVWDGWSRENLPPIPDSDPKQSQFTIPEVLSSHQKYLIRCYPELSFLHSVPRIPEITVTVDPALYLQFIIEQLNTRTYPPPYPRLCSAINYARDSRLVNDSSSSDEEESLLVINSGRGRWASPELSTTPNLRDFSILTFPPLSLPSSPPHTLPYFNLTFSKSEAIEAMKVIDAVKAQTKNKTLVSIHSSTGIPNETVHRTYSSDLSSEDNRPLRKVMKFNLENRKLP